MKAQHLKDIDFRSREERQSEAIKEIQQWHDIALVAGDMSQVRAFASVLWLLMPEKDYKKFMKSPLEERNEQDEEEIQLQIIAELAERGIL